MHYLLPLIEKTAGYWANLTGKAARTAKETLETAEAAHKPLATASKASAVKLKAALHKLRDTTRGTAPKPSVWKRDLFDWSGVGAATKGSENALNELTASLATAKASTANKRAARDTYIEAVKDRKKARGYTALGAGGLAGGAVVSKALKNRREAANNATYEE